MRRLLRADFGDKRFLGTIIFSARFLVLVQKLVFERDFEMDRRDFIKNSALAALSFPLVKGVKAESEPQISIEDGILTKKIGGFLNCSRGFNREFLFTKDCLKKLDEEFKPSGLLLGVPERYRYSMNEFQGKIEKLVYFFESFLWVEGWIKGDPKLISDLDKKLSNNQLRIVAGYQPWGYELPADDLIAPCAHITTSTSLTGLYLLEPLNMTQMYAPDWLEPDGLLDGPDFGTFEWWDETSWFDDHPEKRWSVEYYERPFRCRVPLSVIDDDDKCHEWMDLNWDRIKWLD